MLAVIPTRAPKAPPTRPTDPRQAFSCTHPYGCPIELNKVKQPTLFEAFNTPPPKAAPTAEIEPLAKALLWFRQHEIEGKVRTG